MACSSLPACITPRADQLERFRALVDDARRVRGFERAVAAASAAGLALASPELKRAPKGYTPDHPRIDLLRLKTLTVSQRHRVRKWLHTKECDKRVIAQLEACKPLVGWLAEHVGPSTRQRFPN